MRTRTEVVGKARVSGDLPAILPEARHELWSHDPRGDLDGAFFDLPTPVRLEHVQKAARQCWDKWVALKRFEGLEPASEPRVVGPFRVPTHDQLDVARYYMLARFRRWRPRLITLDEAEEYFGLEMPSPEEMYSNFFANLAALSEKPLAEMEKETRRLEEYKRVAEREREFHEALARRLGGER